MPANTNCRSRAPLSASHTLPTTARLLPRGERNDKKERRGKLFHRRAGRTLSAANAAFSLPLDSLAPSALETFLNASAGRSVIFNCSAGARDTPRNQLLPLAVLVANVPFAIVNEKSRSRELATGFSRGQRDSRSSRELTRYERLVRHSPRSLGCCAARRRMIPSIVPELRARRAARGYERTRRPA